MTGERFICIDPAGRDGDWSCAVTGRWLADGSVAIDSLEVEVASRPVDIVMTPDRDGVFRDTRSPHEGDVVRLMLRQGEGASA